MNRNRTSLRALAVAAASLGSAALFAQSSFTAIPYPATGGFSSVAFAVSQDGGRVVGDSDVTGGFMAYEWSLGGGTVGLGVLPGGATDSTAWGVSNDGLVIVGQSDSSSGIQAFRYVVGSGMSLIGDLPGGTVDTGALGISGNGLVVVGAGVSGNGEEAFRWTSGGGFQPLGDLAGGAFFSQAWSANLDGSVVVGLATSASGQQAFRWTSGGGMVGLGDLPGGSSVSWAYHTNDDGSVVVGFSNSSNGDEAFRWTSGGGMVGLGDLPGSVVSSIAYGVDGSGNIVVGTGTSADGDEAFVWRSGFGMRRVRDLLISQGLESSLANWILIDANAVSRDGTAIVGSGVNPSGNIQAYRAAGLLIDDGTISGTLNFLSLSGAKPATTFEFRTQANSSVFSSHSITPSGTGAYSVTTFAGNFRMAVKASTFLRRVVSVDTTTSDVTGMDLSLTNGDVNGDNSVNVADFLLIRAAFGTTSGGGGYNPNADLNKDGSVNISDFLIFRASFGQSGDAW